MAKSTKTRSSKSPTAPAGKRQKNPATDKIVGLSEMIVTAAAKKKDPAFDVPLRTLSNAHYSKTKRIIEMGNKAATRNFFDLGKARSFMQTVLIASGCKSLIDQDKTL